MSDKLSEKELLKIAEQAAAGKKINPLSTSDSKISDAFEIISQVKQSFQQSEKTFHQQSLVKIGDTWGHLRIEKEIGSGGMGLVYQAYDNILDRQVAVKFLNPKSNEYISSKSFILEARRLAKVRHPNVLAIYGANTFKDTTGFWSELLTGETLSDLLKDDLSWDKILLIARDLSRSIREVHNNDIIHGDIKPLNIMLNKDGRVVLMDFGSGSDLNHDHSQISTSTPLIMAPELFKGLPKTKASDIYALGVVFYFISTKGCFPYNAQSISELRKQVFLQKPIDFSQAVGTRRWIALIKSMLCFEPETSPTIDEVIKEVKLIKTAPARRKKKITIFSIVSLLLSTILILFYSNLSLEKEQAKTELALNETKQYNTLMHNMLSSASPIFDGKDVLMVDVIDEFIQIIIQNKNISNLTKARALYSLAQTQFNLGKQKEGIVILDEILSNQNIDKVLKTSVLMKKAHYELIKSNSNQLSIDESEKLLKQALDILNKNSTHNKELNADYTFSMGELYYYKKDFDKAEVYFLDVLEYYSSLNEGKTESHKMSLVYSSLGNIYNERSLFSKAAEYFEKALIKADSSRSKYYILVTKSQFAANLMESGQSKKGIIVFGELIQQVSDFFGTNHPFYFQTISNLAAAYLDNGKYEESLIISEKLIAHIINDPGKKSLVYVNAQGNLANTYMYLKKYEEAEKIYYDVIKISSELYGENSFQVLLNQYNLSELYYKSGQPQKTLSLLEKRLPVAIKELGEKQVITIEMKDAEAWANYLLGNNNEAFILMQKVVNLKKQVYGEENEVTKKAIMRLKTINTQQ